jgi:hypothetical protein
MAGHRRKYGRYGRRTAAQQAALRKAQLASARKRRIKSTARTVAYIGGGILAAAAVSGATRAANHPIKTYKGAQKIRRNLSDRRKAKTVKRVVSNRKPRPIQYWGTREHRRAAYAGQAIHSRIR